MSVATLIFLIPIVAIVGGVFLSAMKISAKNKKMTAAQQVEFDSMKQTIAELQSRIEVLERLATEDNQSLKREFERL